MTCHDMASQAAPRACEEGAALAADRQALRRRVIALLEDELASIGFELLDVRLFLGGGRMTVRVVIDGPAGVDIDACARASRTAGMLLEEAALIEEAYVMEVSSPGVRRPLRTPAHFAAALGVQVEIRTGQGARARTLRGRLLAATSEGVTVLAREAAASAPSPDEEGEDDDESGSQGRAAAGAAEAGAPAVEVEVPYAEIAAANLDPEFDFQALINADRRRRREQKRQQRQQERQARAARAARRRGPDSN